MFSFTEAHWTGSQIPQPNAVLVKGSRKSATHLQSQGKPANSLHSALWLRSADSRASKNFPSSGCSADTSSAQVSPGSGALICLFRVREQRFPHSNEGDLTSDATAQIISTGWGMRLGDAPCAGHVHERRHVHGLGHALAARLK
jgi:hypothetical protein